MPHGTAPPPSPESLTASQFARRERIVKVALNLLVNGDYEKIQMKDVAEASDVALGTVYRYFTSKEHLFAAVQLEWVKSLHRQILRRPPSGQSNLERLSQVLHKSVRAFQIQPQFYRVLLVLEVAKDPFAKELFEVMSRETEATYRESLSGVDRADRLGPARGRPGGAGRGAARLGARAQVHRRGQAEPRCGALAPPHVP